MLGGMLLYSIGVCGVASAAKIETLGSWRVAGLALGMLAIQIGSLAMGYMIGVETGPALDTLQPE